MVLNILVTLPLSKYGDSFLAPEVSKILESMGHVIWNHTDRQFKPDELKENLKASDVCISGWGCPQFDRYVLESAEKLKLIAHTGGSVSSLVSEYLYDRGIKVISGNRLYAESVAEGTLAYILSSMRSIPAYSDDVKNGGWRTSGFFNEGLFDRKIGLVGFGMVAKDLVKMLVPFRVKVKVYDPYVKETALKEYGVEGATLEDIFSTCSIISIHAPKIPETYHMVDRRLLDMIPDGAVFINTARGNIVEEDALVDILRKNRFKAVLDVFEVEPLPLNSALRSLDNVILMPHMAGPTLDRRKHVTIALIEDINNFFNGNELLHEIIREYAMLMTR